MGWRALLGVATVGCTIVTDLDALQRSRDGGPVGNSFCSKSQHTFCEDFDVHAFGETWSSTTRNVGSIGLDPTTSVSPPKSLLVSASTSSSGSSALYKNLDLMKAVHVSMQLYVERNTSDMGYEVDPVRIDYVVPPSGFGTYSVHISIYDTGPVIEEGGRHTNGMQDLQTTPIAAGIDFAAPWKRYGLELTNGEAHMLVDGNIVTTRTLRFSPTGSVQVVVGGAYATQVQAWSIHVDDVTIDVE
jgi:hypothetical protein